MEKISVAQRVANRLFAAENSIDRAITDASQLLAETMAARRNNGNGAARLDNSVDEITASVAALVKARRALEAANPSPDGQPPSKDSEPPAKTDSPPVWRPDHWFASLAELKATEIDRKLFALELHDLLYACDLALLPEADRLYVTLHAYGDRQLQQPPFFQWERGLYDNGHVLRISDPTLFLNDELAISAFIGPERQSPIEGVVEIARYIGRQLGIREEQIIYWGRSGGAFAALMAATVSPRGRAVAINAQLDASRFDGAAWARPIRETFREGWSFVDIGEAYPVRMSVANALKWALRRGHNPRLLLVQNDADTMCYDDQFVPFCTDFGLDPAASSRSQNVQTLVFHNWRGHNAVPRKVLKQISNEGLPFLLGKESAQVSGPLNPSWWNEEFYLRHNPDIARAVRKGLLRTGLEHYQMAGADEKRLTAPPSID
jgi:hypothetical protein